VKGRRIWKARKGLGKSGNFRFLFVSTRSLDYDLPGSVAKTILF